MSNLPTPDSLLHDIIIQGLKQRADDTETWFNKFFFMGDYSRRSFRDWEFEKECDANEGISIIGFARKLQYIHAEMAAVKKIALRYPESYTDTGFRPTDLESIDWEGVKKAIGILKSKIEPVLVDYFQNKLLKRGSSMTDEVKQAYEAEFKPFYKSFSLTTNVQP